MRRGSSPGQFVEARPTAGRQLLDRQFVVAPSQVLDEGMAATTTLAVRSRFRPRIGRVRAFNRP